MPDPKPFDPILSLEIDRAQAALDEARESGDELRELNAREWREKATAVIWEDET